MLRNLVRLTLICTLINVRFTLGEYTLKLRLIDYINYQRKLQDHTCCDRFVGPCEDCDPVLEICVSDEQAIKRANNNTIDCNLGLFETKEYTDKNYIRFGTLLGPLLSNPIIIYGARKWKGQISIRIIIHEMDDGQKSKIINDFQATSYHKAAPRITTAREQVMEPMVGPQDSELTYAIRIFCSNYYFGSDCSKYCKPADDNGTGHFTCDRHGNKVCRKGFK